MKKCTIAISSVNHALRAEKLLSGRSWRCKIVKLQPNETKKGCAYGIEVSCKDVPSALSFLSDAHIAYSEVLR